LLRPWALGIIPARGGSKGIVKKNLARVGGLTLVAHAVRSAREACLLRHVILSTEDDEIRDEAMECGVHVCERPIELAADDTEMLDVVLHALTYAEQFYNCRYLYVAILQPTSPLREGADIDGALLMLEQTGADSVVTITSTHPRTWMTDEQGTPIWPTPRWNNRQKLPHDFVRNGAVYAIRTTCLQKGMLFGPLRRAYHMPAWRSVNINAQDDLITCEALWREHHCRGGSGPRGESV
jgi:N-acylneuraminate cytidylyltransferase